MTVAGINLSLPLEVINFVLNQGYLIPMSYILCRTLLSRVGWGEGDGIMVASGEKSNEGAPPAAATVCPRSSVPFHIVTYYIKWITTPLALTDVVYAG